jgi:PhnB protein
MLAALTSTLVVFASLRLAEKPSTARALVVAALGLLAVEARPDNVIIATLCPMLALGLLAPARGLHPAVIRSSALIWAAAWVGLVVADETLKWRLLGTPVPLAFYAKQPGYYCRFAGEFTWNPFWFLEVALAAVAPFLVATMLCARRTSMRLLVVLLAPAGLTMVALFSVNHIMGHRGRFFVPSLPLFIVAGVLVTDEWIGSRRAVGIELPPGGRPGPHPRVARAMLLRLACALFALVGGGRALESAGRRYERRAETQQLAPVDDDHISAAAPLPELDSWQASQEVALLAAASPPGTTIALSEHGLVGADAPRAVLIDVLGLHDPIFGATVSPRRSCGGASLTSSGCPTPTTHRCCTTSWPARSCGGTTSSIRRPSPMAWRCAWMVHAPSSFGACCRLAGARSIRASGPRTTSPNHAPPQVAPRCPGGSLHFENGLKTGGEGNHMAKTKNPVPQGYHTVTASLTLDEAARAIEWYQRAFGAEEITRNTGPDGKIMHAEIQIGDSRVMLNDAMMGGKSAQTYGGSAASLWLYVNDCDALFNRAVAAGAQALMPLGDQFWGDRFGAILDPFGYRWSIATHTEDLSVEEIQQREAAWLKEFAAQGGQH